MPLSQKQIEELVNARTYFEYAVNLDNGDLETIEKSNDIQNKLVFRFNEKVTKRIRDYLPRVLNQRGITAPDEIDNRHPQVQSKINKLRSQKKNSRNVSEEEIISVINMVRNAHQPQYLTALMQVILWSISYDDLFKINKTTAGTSLETKINLEVPDDYWDSKVDSDDELLNAMVGDMWTVSFKKFDKSNPLEIMLATVSSLFDSFPESASIIGKLQNNVLVNFSFSNAGVDYDDATFLNGELDTVLHKFVLREHTII